MVWASGTDSSNQSLSFSLTFHCMFFTHRISRHAELDGRWGGSPAPMTLGADDMWLRTALCVTWRQGHENGFLDRSCLAHRRAACLPGSGGGHRCEQRGICRVSLTRSGRDIPETHSLGPRSRQDGPGLSAREVLHTAALT